LKDIKKTIFSNQSLQLLGIDPKAFADLKPKLPKQPERLAFYMLLLVESGSGKHKIDFVDYCLDDNSFLFVRPGQVQEWIDYHSLSGEIILIDPLSLPHAEGFSGQVMQHLSLEHWPNSITLSNPVKTDLITSIQRLKQDIEGYDGSKMDITLIQHELVGLLLRMSRWLRQNEDTPKINTKSQKTFDLFKQLLEQEYKHQPNLSFYAHRLGYSQSTISRACLRTEGISAKKVIDQRISLEAKRMLVHSPLSVAEIGYSLGFSEATNFNKFFRRLENTTPQEFRHTARN